MITLTIHLDGPAEEATLFWLAPDGGEARYADMRRGSSVRQETFAGHTWIVRDKATGDELMRLTASAAPAEQAHRIDAGTVGTIIGPARPAAAEPAGPEVEAAAGDSEPDEEPARAGGVWASDAYRFERVTRVRGRRMQPTIWRELNEEGQEVARHVQVGRTGGCFL
jgi:hypothetical protein